MKHEATADEAWGAAIEFCRNVGDNSVHQACATGDYRKGFDAACSLLASVMTTERHRRLSQTPNEHPFIADAALEALLVGMATQVGDWDDESPWDHWTGVQRDYSEALNSLRRLSAKLQTVQSVHAGRVTELLTANNVAVDRRRAMRAERDEALDHIRDQIETALVRIADGREMGASVWRIALEDLARESRAFLAGKGLG